VEAQPLDEFLRFPSSDGGNDNMSRQAPQHEENSGSSGAALSVKCLSASESTIARSSYAGSAQKIGPWGRRISAAGSRCSARGDGQGQKTAKAALRRFLVTPPGQVDLHWPRRGVHCICLCTHSIKQLDWIGASSYTTRAAAEGEAAWGR